LRRLLVRCALEIADAKKARDHLAALCVTDGKPPEAWRPLDGTEPRAAGEVEGYVARLIETAELKDQRGGAIPHYEEAIPLAPEDVAQALMRGERSIEVQLACAEKEQFLKNRVKAREHLKRGLELQGQRRVASDPAQFHLLWHLANLLLDEAADPAADPDRRKALLAEAEQRLAQLRKTRGLPAAADYLEARLLVSRDRWADAAVLLLRVRPVLEKNRELGNQINLFLGQCYERLEEPVLMEDVYRRIADNDPDSVPGRLGLAWALYLQGKLDDALVQYRAVEKQGGVP